MVRPLEIPVVLNHDHRQDKVDGMVDSGALTNFVAQAVIVKYHLEPFVRKINPASVRPAFSASITSEEMLCVPAVAYADKPIKFEFRACVVKGLHRDCYLGTPFITRYQKMFTFPEYPEVSGEADTAFDTVESGPALGVPEKAVDAAGTVSKPVPDISVVDAVHFKRQMKNCPIGVLLVTVPDEKNTVPLNTVKIEIPVDHAAESTQNIWKEFADVVTDDPPVEMPPHREIEHQIQLKEDSKPVWRHQYRLSFEEKKELQKQVAELIEQGFIRPSTSPYNAPVLFVKKKDGSLRLCVDYRLLNDETVKDRFPLPLIDEIFDTVGSAKIFSKLDLMSGFYQIRVAGEDIPKTAFSTASGHYEWTVMPFGLTNAPATFQRFMNQILQPYLGKFALVYIDDIIIYSNTIEEHREHIKEVLSLLRENHMRAKKKKCVFFCKQIKFLGSVIGNGGVYPDPEKIAAIRDWPPLHTPHDAMRFLGLAGYYRRFVKDYAKIASPLDEFSSKKKPWSDAQEKSFVDLKKALMKAPLLVAPIFEEGYKFVVTTDASNEALGFVLEQLDPQGKLRGVVSYGSKKLANAELRYPIREKEFYAIVTALHKFRSYLLYRPFIIKSDHNSLIYLKRQKQVNTGRLVRWLDFLSQYGFDIVYIPGPTNKVADALSRPPDDSPDDLEDETEIEALTTTRLQPDASKIQQLIDGHKSDQEFSLVYQTLKNKEPIPKKIANHIKHFSIGSDGLLYYTPLIGKEATRVCVPDADQVRKKIISQGHDLPTSGHFGWFKTLELLTRNFYWNNMSKDIKNYVSTCEACLRSKPMNIAEQGLFKPLPVPEGRWTHVTMDFVGALPKTVSGHDTVMVIVDRFSKRAHFIPTVKALTAEGAAKLYMDHIFRLHGVPYAITSDKDIRFVNAFWQTIHDALGTSLFFSTTNHPQTDGQSERTIRTLVQLLRSFCGKDILHWDEFLFAAEFAYNSTKQGSIDDIPFKVDLGYIPDSPSWMGGAAYTNFHPRAASIMEHTKALMLQTKITQDQLVHAQHMQEVQENRHRSPHTYGVGQYVLIHRDALKYLASNAYCKIEPAYLGPFRLVKKSNDNAFEVDLPSTIKRDRVLNVRWFKPFEMRSEAYPKKPPRTHLEILSRISELTGVAGYDPKKQQLFVHWQDCDPRLSSIISYNEFDRAPRYLRASLIAEARGSTTRPQSSRTNSLLSGGV